MITTNQVLAALTQLAPIDRKMDFDNVGLLVGRGEAPVSRILTALDVTDEVVQEAIEQKAELIAAHHPVIFHPVKSITDTDSTGRLLLKLTENHIAAICMHTNLDAADGGVNDALASVIGLQNLELLTTEGIDFDGKPYCCGRIGLLAQGLPDTMLSFLPYLKEVLKADGLRYHDAGRPVHKLAVVGGSGGSYLEAAFQAGCDTLITADIKYDVFLTAKALGMNIIDADHFCTENPVVPVITNYLTSRFPALTVLQSKCHRQTALTWK